MNKRCARLTLSAQLTPEILFDGFVDGKSINQKSTKRQLESFNLNHFGAHSVNSKFNTISCLINRFSAIENDANTVFINCPSSTLFPLSFAKFTNDFRSNGFRIEHLSLDRQLNKHLHFDPNEEKSKFNVKPKTLRSKCN